MQDNILKNKGLEDNVFKQRVREDIFSQIKKLHYKESKTYSNLDMFTLPGEQCKFEKMASEYYSNPALLTLLSIDCAEGDKEKIKSTRLNLPKEAKVELGMLDDVICKSIRTGNGKEYDVIWLDYCCAITPIIIEQMTKYATLCLKPQGTIYITCWIKGIKCKTGSKQALADLATVGTIYPDLTDSNKDMSNEELRNIIFNEITKKFKTHGLTKMRPIYNVIYGGGEMENTPMLTIGFSKNIMKKDPNYIKLIHENRIDTNKIAKKVAKRKLENVKDIVSALFDQQMPDKAIREMLKISTPALAAYKSWYRKQGVPWRIKERV